MNANGNSYFWYFSDTVIAGTPPREAPVWLWADPMPYRPPGVMR